MTLLCPNQPRDAGHCGLHSIVLTNDGRGNIVTHYALIVSKTIHLLAPSMLDHLSPST
jgi:hypothetical protein